MSTYSEPSHVERPVYTYGMPGNRWQLLHNKNKGIRKFEPIPFIADEPRYQHFLGRDCLQNGLEIRTLVRYALLE
jgi:hypothetical protein